MGPKVVVVGGGPVGLSAAIRLKKRGFALARWKIKLGWYRNGKPVTTTPGLSVANLIRNLSAAGAVATLRGCSTTIAWSSQVRGVW